MVFLVFTPSYLIGRAPVVQWVKRWPTDLAVASSLLEAKFSIVNGVPGCLRSSLSWLNCWVSFAPDFQYWYFCEPSCLFYLKFNFDFYVS